MVQMLRKLGRTWVVEYISPRLMCFVTEPHVFWSKFTEILYQVLPSNSRKDTKCRFHTENGESTATPRRVTCNKMVQDSTVKTH